MTHHTQDRSQKPVTSAPSLLTTSRDDAASLCSRGNGRTSQDVGGNTSRRPVSMPDGLSAAWLLAMRSVGAECYHGEVAP